MTPEDLERMHADAVKNGANPILLERLRREALAECGSVEAMARWADFNERLDHFYRDIRGEFRRRH